MNIELAMYLEGIKAQILLTGGRDWQYPLISLISHHLFSRKSPRYILCSLTEPHRMGSPLLSLFYATKVAYKCDDKEIDKCNGF